MSDLLNQASLVMVPSGYKEDTVYSVVPSDGSGDLSFTRASNGTRVNSAGLVEVCPWNLTDYSEDFSNGFWTKLNTTITTNATTAPNGTTTADKVISSVVNDEHLVYYFSSQYFNQVVTLSAYVKKSDYRYAILRSFTNSAYRISVFDLDNGVVTSQDLGTSTIESVGNGWFRISTTYTTPGGTYAYQYAFSATQTFNYLGDGTSGNFLWGAMVNIGSTAKPYFPTTDRLNVPRLTYQNGGGGCPSLLLEKQSTNILTYSEQFDNGAWVKSDCSITANNTTSPDGTQNADTFTETTFTNAVATVGSNTITITSGTPYTSTIYAKQGNGRYLYFGVYYFFGNAYYTIIADLQTGTITKAQAGSAVSNASNSIVNVGNGWYRISMTQTASFSSIVSIFRISDSASPTIDATYGFIVVPSNNNRSISIWGAQLEAGSYPTSYIPTTTSSATRVADACFKTGISSLIGQTEGVIFWEGKISDVTGGELCDLNANGDKFIQIYNTLVGSTPTIGLYIQNVTVLLNNSNIATIAYNSNFKFALAYKNNDYVAYLNGAQVYVNTTIGVPATSNFSIGAYNQGNVTANKNTNQVALFKTRLTNAELASLTTI